MTRAARIVATLLLAAAAACGTNAASDAGIATEDVRFADVRAMDAAVGVDVVPVDPCGPSVCLAHELCGVVTDGGTASGNGTDDNCNGTVDEGCTCPHNGRQSCWPGPPDRRNLGECRDGVSLCTELGIWADCTGATLPGIEVCDGRDNDCNGQVDEGLTECASTLACPVDASSHPLQDYTIDGRSIDPMGTTFAWTFECPDGLSPCPAPVSATDPVFTVHPVQSGRYVVRLAVTRADGSANTCRFPLYVAGDGIRFELDWDTKGGIGSSGVDLDLHVAPDDHSFLQTPAWFTDNDCYYATCTSARYTATFRSSETDTRYAPSSDAVACAGDPPPYGAQWQSRGSCANPRLDTDDKQCDPRVTDPRSGDYCFIENVNVDVIPHDVTFRAMVNFYQDHGTCTDADAADDDTHPELAVYCGGLQRALVGDVDTGIVTMRCRDNASLGSSNWSWLAADVTPGDPTCGGSDCRVTVLLARPGAFTACNAVTDADDRCEDGAGHVFVRRAGGRPINADVASP